MTLIRLTHANHGTTLYISRDLVAGFYYSAHHKCTHVVASGGAVFPAKESLDDVKRLLTGSTEAATHSSNGGTHGKNERPDGEVSLSDSRQE